jgi:biopolymer transport protein ExbD
MRKPVIPRAHRIGFNMTPMIDVTFLLIIFFLVSSHLARQESSVQLALPVAPSGEDDPATPLPRVVINVTPDGTLSVAGRTISADDLPGHLALAREELGEGMEVRIRASRSAIWQHVEPVLLACTRQGIWNVSWAVYREDP